VTEDTERCLNCERSSDEVPLLVLKYAGRESWICPQCLPILIHHPERIAAVSGAWINRETEHEGG